MISVLRPKLPSADAILPYLRQIDAGRWYSNFGPLVQAFEHRLAKAAGLQEDNLAVVANGTLGLTVALQSLEVLRGTLCVMPSWTFTATPAAALAAGLLPCFLDVDKETQALSPELVKAALRRISANVGSVVAVSPFGAPVDTLAWDRFTEETGIPVVIDAAAAFDCVCRGLMNVSRSPMMVSLHATKSFGIGEGGVLLSRNPDVIFRSRRIINFGFESDRRSHRIAINAKLSEYSAAVGLAALDAWEKTRSEWARVRDCYITTLSKTGIRLWLDPEWVTSTCNIVTPNLAPEVSAKLAARGIETRRWWLTGCHAQPAYRNCTVHGDLSVTQWLGQSVVGLPASVDMGEHAVSEVCNAVIAAVGQTKVT